MYKNKLFNNFKSEFLETEALQLETLGESMEFLKFLLNYDIVPSRIQTKKGLQ